MLRLIQFIAGTLLKAVVGLGGLFLTFWYLIVYIFKKDRSQLRRAGVTFFTTVGVIILISVVEFLFIFSNTEKDNKNVVLVAAREAPLGGIELKLYNDRSFELGNLRKVKRAGTYSISGDTLTIANSDSVIASFLIEEKELVEIQNTGIHSLDIHENNLR